MDRPQFIDWVIRGALGWLEAGKHEMALIVFQQHLEQYPDFALSWYAEKGVFMAEVDLLETPEQVRAYIEGLRDVP